MNNSLAYISISKKETIRIFRIWKQTILPSVINATLYFLIFWAFIGQRIKEVNGIPYIDFLVPGFIMMSVMTASYMNVSSSFFGAKFQKSIEEILTAPIPAYIVILWYITWGIVRWLSIAVAIYIIAHFFTNVYIQHPFIAILFLFFSTSLFSLVWLFNAFFARNFDDVNIIPTFVITPLIYLGWVFYPITALTGIWFFVSNLNPIYYMINGLRFWFLWVTEVNIYTSLWVLILFNFLVFWVNVWMYKNGKGLKN